MTLSTVHIQGRGDGNQVKNLCQRFCVHFCILSEKYCFPPWCSLAKSSVRVSVSADGLLLAFKMNSVVQHVC